MKIENYLHLYLGCEVMRVDTNHTMRLQAVFDYGDNYTPNDKTINMNGSLWSWEMFKEKCKPILRPLSDMTEEEREDIGSIGYFNPVFDKPLDEEALNPAQFHWLLSRHFDLFNLIPEGLAISSPLPPKDKTPV